eukprot:1745041-Rhodomonas_salina.2
MRASSSRCAALALMGARHAPERRQLTLPSPANITVTSMGSARYPALKNTICTPSPSSCAHPYPVGKHHSTE